MTPMELNLAAHQIAEAFPVPLEFARTVIQDLSGDLDLTHRWLSACSLSGRYFAPKSLKTLKPLDCYFGWRDSGVRQ